MKEIDLAKELIRWRDLNMHRYPCLRLFYHIPNEGKRSKWVSKAVGIVAGMPDYCMPVSAYGYHSHWLELKAPCRKPTLAQLDIMEQLRDWKNHVIWTDSLQVAIDTLEWYCRGVK